MSDEQFGDEAAAAGGGSPISQEVDLRAMSSVTLARLFAEVENEQAPIVAPYNRTYNRHNR